MVAVHVAAFVTLLPGVVLAQATAADPAAPAAPPAEVSPPAAPSSPADPAGAPSDAPAPAPSQATPAPAEPAGAPAAAAAAKPEAAPAPAQPAAPPSSDPLKGHVLDTTGYVLPGGSAEFGLFYLGYGITDWLSVGTSPGLWVAGPLVGGLVANVSVKAGVPIAPWMIAGLEVTPIYLRVNRDGATTRGFVFPVTLAGTFIPTASQDYSLGLRYVAITGEDQSSTSTQEVGGTVVTSLAQITADARYLFTEKFGLYGRGYFEFWEKNVGAHGVYQPDDSTTITVEGEADAKEGSRPWAAILGVHFRFGNNVNLRIGAGYGNFFVPRIGVFVPDKSFFPDLDFYVRF